MKAYIDDYRLIRIEITEPISFISFPEIEGELIYYNNKPYYKLKKDISLNKDYYFYINDSRVYLEIGLVTKSEKFVSENYYKDSLGIKYEKDKTTFRLFAPVSKDVILVLDNKKYKMKQKKGLYEKIIKGDHLNKEYYYLVKNATFYQKVLDPYAKIGNNNISFITDITTYYDNKQIRKLENSKNNNPIICEMHIKDVSNKLDIKNKGLYLGLLEKSDKLDGMNVLDYIKSLGFNYIQLQPVLDFLGVSDLDKDKYYNWGYNPFQFFILDGWYSKDPNNPILRFNEFSMVVDYCHKIGLGVILDVVYNHVFTEKMFPASQVIPNYFQVFNSNKEMTSFSGCGNDFDILKKLSHKMVRDSLSFITSVYKIDGYRFDLMGLMDVRTMNNIKTDLLEINPNILLYGEGWNMETIIPKEERANQLNCWKLTDYAFFNDFFREYFKNLNGIKFDGFSSYDIKDLEKYLNGTPNIFYNYNQSVNYIECHDDMTYYDHLVYNKKISPYLAKEYQLLAMYYIAISKGIAFYQIGMENFRTKKGKNNTYKDSSGINDIIWDLENPYLNDFKEILKIRNNYLANIKDIKCDFNNDILEIIILGNNKINTLIKNGKINYKPGKNEEIIYKKSMNNDILDIITVYEKNSK